VSMTPRLWRLALHCSVEELKARKAGKATGVMSWNAELVRALTFEVEVSSTRQETCCGAPQLEHDDDEWIGAKRAAELLRWGLRRVERHHTDLDGRKKAGKWFFRESVVREYAEALTHGRDFA
jgi:hypothetical protein